MANDRALPILWNYLILAGESLDRFRFRVPRFGMIKVKMPLLNSALTLPVSHILQTLRFIALGSA
jgi:hypothetical protein